VDEVNGAVGTSCLGAALQSSMMTAQQTAVNYESQTPIY
jgi:hypothetical protein